MPDSNADEARDALLVKAAQAWADDAAFDSAALDSAGLGSGDSVLCYLRDYYHRVLTEDLAAPSRLAVVAEAHAQLGLHRPQGRALVAVREAGPARLDGGGPSNLVVDIVTDDMPYLVDSVTTRLNRHRAEIRLLVHPLLRVRRDVVGNLQQIVGLCPGGEESVPASTDELTESWIHVELEPPADGVTAEQLGTDLRLVLDDVRVSAEDKSRMEAAAHRLAGDLGREPGPAAVEYGALLNWLADGNFMFLGYREYDLVAAAGGAALRPVAGTGLGILRHPGAAGTRCASCPPRSRPAPRTRPSGSCWPRPTPAPPSTGPATWTTSRSRSSARTGR